MANVTDEERDRKEVCRIISDMLDNPGVAGIFRTTDCFDRICELIAHERVVACADERRKMREWHEERARSCALDGEGAITARDPDMGVIHLSMARAHRESAERLKERE